MSSFKGFPSGKVSFTHIPEPFFSELLPQVDDLHELKILLYFIWRVGKMEGNFHCLKAGDMMQDKTFLAGMGGNEEEARENINSGIQKAAARGALLQAEIELGNQPVKFYLLNTLRGQAAVKAIQEGKWSPSGNPDYPISLELEKPNVFQLYEEHIGPLTPMIAEALRDAEKEYSAEWIETAIKEAVVENVRKWRYVVAILKNWKEEATDARANRQDDQKDFRRYGKGKYGKIVKKTDQ